MSPTQNLWHPITRKVSSVNNVLTVLYIPVVAVLAGETLEVIDVALGLHDHLKGRNDFPARCAVPSCSK